MSENQLQNSLESRIIELETKLLFQEDLLQELNTHVITQQKQIEKLNTLCDSLREQYKEIVSSLEDSVSGNEIPPHY